MINLNDDFYIFDEKTYSLLGRDTGQIIRLGDEVRVRVDSVDVSRREVEFNLVESLSEHDALPLLPKADRKKSRRRRKKGSQ
jgi:ribonuclease R